jgi:phage repressor protein C with HTH and peptisase S24 domain
MQKAKESTSNLATGFGQRIAQVAKKTGGKRALADNTGISPSQLYRYIAEQSLPTINPLAAIAKEGGVSLDWLITGAGAAEIGEQDAVDRHVSIPQVRQSFFAHDRVPQESDILADILIDQRWVAKKGRPGDMVVVEMSGHNMYPSLVNGDLVMIDRSRLEPLPGKIFAFWLNAGMIIRRLDIRPDRYVLASDDARHDPLDIDPDKWGEIRILGQIVWVFREVR